MLSVCVYVRFARACVQPDLGERMDPLEAAGDDRAAMACHLKIDAEGKVKDWRFTRAIVRIHEA